MSDGQLRPGDRVGRFRLEHPLGGGGMGVVWAAWDDPLNRTVALKLMRGDALADPDSRVRFVREARFGARLRHPGIVAVYDAGEHEGQLYVALEWIKGQTFADVLEDQQGKAGDRDRLAPDTLRARITTLAAVAEATACAHEAGVLHRDLKPANILIDDAGHPHVTDFGLARELLDGAAASGGNLTQAGDVMGTPAYMSPEQAAGATEKICAAADVWSLGAILYEILAGAPPYSDAGSVWDVLETIRRDDPSPLRERDPRIPAELAAVCHAALQRDPADRIATAHRFGENLRCWLRGDPVSIERASWPRRLLRRIRRRPMIAAPVVLALVVGLVMLAGREIRHATAARAQERLHQIGLAVKGLEARVRSTVTTAEVRRELARQPLGLIEAYMQDRPDDGVALAWRGTLHATLGDLERAQTDLDQACAVSPARALVWTLRGRFSIERYRRQRGLPRPRISDLGLTFDGAEPESAESAALRERGLGDLAMQGTLPDTEAVFDAADQRTIRALIALHSTAATGPAEAIELLGESTGPRADIIRGTALYLMRRFPDAIEHLSRAIAEWPEDPELHLRMGEARFAEALTQVQRGVDPRPDLRAAIDALSGAFGRDPTLSAAFALRPQAQMYLGDAELDRGIDPRALYQAALTDLIEITRQNATNADAWIMLGNVYWRLGRAAGTSSETALLLLQKAEQAMGRAVKLSPRSAFGWCNLANVRLTLADALAHAGQSPRPTLVRAEEDATAALGIEPTFLSALINRALARCALADADQAAGGADPTPLEQAIADLDAAAKLHPDIGRVYLCRASAWYTRAILAWGQGRDPLDAFAHALQDFDTALKLNPEDPRTYVNRGLAYARRAEWQMQRGRDMGDDLARAIADYSAALERNPELPQAWINRGNAHCMLGDQAAAAGQDAREEYRLAIADFDELLRRQPRNLDGRSDRAFTWAAIAKSAGADEPEWELGWQRALDDYETALAQAPGHWRVRVNRAGAATEYGQAKLARQIDPGDLFQRAVQDFDQVLQANPRLALAHIGAGQALAAEADRARWQGADPKPHEVAAEQRFRTAIAGGDARAWLPLSNLLTAAGRDADAIVAYEALAKCFSSHAAMARERIAEARRRLNARAPK